MPSESLECEALRYLLLWPARDVEVRVSVFGFVNYQPREKDTLHNRCEDIERDI